MKNPTPTAMATTARSPPITNMMTLGVNNEARSFLWARNIKSFDCNIFLAGYLNLIVKWLKSIQVVINTTLIFSTPFLHLRR